MGLEPSRERIQRFLVCLLGVCLGAFPGAIRGEAFEPTRVPGRLVLTLRAYAAAQVSQRDTEGLPRTGIAALDELNRSTGAQRFAPLFRDVSVRKAKSETGVDLSRFFSLDFDTSTDLEWARSAYEALDAVERAEFDWMQPLHLETNDSFLQWHLESRNGMDAHITGGWNHTTGDTSIILAIADSGVDWMHPDLGGTGPEYVDGNIWINWAEYNGIAGVDDDGNRLVDDIRGWDFVQTLGLDAWPGEDATVQDNDPRDFNGHGTHVAGIAGARTNNGVGVAGVGFRCRIMPLRVGGSIRDRNGVEQGIVFMSYAADAILYASEQGAAAINCSWGSNNFSPLAVAVDLAVARGVAVVVSAGNDNHQIPSYLASRGDCIDVAATTRDDKKAPFSNFGTWVDVAAPGVDIYSTYYDHTTGQHGYRTLQGTSMAAPIVTGLVGLIKNFALGSSLSEIKEILRAGADDLSRSDPTFASLLGAGRVNALRSFGDRFLLVPGDYPTMAKALAASGVGDTVAVRGDTLFTTPLYIATSNRVLLGGWTAGFEERDTDLPTVITSRGNGPCLEFAAGVDSTMIVDGFRFSGGVARFLSTPNGYFGGGVLCSDASPRLRHCEFDGNVAGSDLQFGGGGGGFFANSWARLSNCRFVGNQATQGAGIFVYNASLGLQECRIEANALHQAAGARGGGVYVEAGAARFQGGNLSRNGQAEDGGALYARSASVELLGTRIDRNSSRTGGGVVLQEGSSIHMENCEVIGNVATHLGGALYSLGSNGQIVNVTFYANSGSGSCLFTQNAPAPWFLRNNVVVGNPNIALFFSGSEASLDYNLFWDNPNGNVQGTTPGAHVLQEDPRFVDPEGFDFALGVHSPAVDSGDPTLLDADGSRSDRGATGGPRGHSRAPAPPDLQAARFIDGATHVTWNANGEDDVSSYALYRGEDSTFVPSIANALASIPMERNSFIDVAGGPENWYRLAAVDSSGASSGFSAPLFTVPADVPLPRSESLEPRSGLSSRPAGLALFPVWPNPANPGTRIAFELPSEGDVWLQVYDVRGRMRRTFTLGVRGPGRFNLQWDGRDDAGRPVPTGSYLLRLEAGGKAVTRKFTLLR